MIDERVRAHVVGWLRRIEIEENVRVLFAIESGSRAWGFASPDSDYDVRFVYAHPQNWYLRLHDGRDVIERPLDHELVDLAGWDVRKALRLLLKSNPPLYEWLCSPLVYLENGGFRHAAKTLFERHASSKALAHHYHHIARGQWRAEIDGRTEVRLKKYFYILRPLLSLQWIAEKGTTPPMQMPSLLAGCAIKSDLRLAIDDLMALKKSTPELGERSRIGDLDAWIRERLDTLNPENLHLIDHIRSETLMEADTLFRATLEAKPDGRSPP